MDKPVLKKILCGIRPSVSNYIRQILIQGVRSLLYLLLVSLLLAGCSGIGPSTVTRDRFDYINAISESWKRQILLNLVKLRYFDAPVFLEVTSVINQYSVEGEVNLGAAWNNPLSRNSRPSGEPDDTAIVLPSPTHP